MHPESLSPSFNLLRHFAFGGLEILELGAGEGALSRAMAEKARRFVAQGPTKSAALRELLSDLPQAEVVDAPDSLRGDFDLVVLIEDREEKTLEAFEQRLRTAIEHLRPDGILLLAATNRLALGSWAGLPERQSGRYFAGIAGAGQDPPSLSRLEWRHHLAELGLESHGEYLLSPDPWQPSCVFAAELIEKDQRLAIDLLCHHDFADAALPSFPLYPSSLLAESVARAGLLLDFAPGFLWFFGGPGSRDRATSLRGGHGSGDLGWHYSLSRSPATSTTFSLREGDLWVAKSALNEARSFQSVCWHAQADQPVLRGERLRQRLIRLAYSGDPSFGKEMASFLAAGKERFATGPQQLAGKALDAILHNAILGEKEGEPIQLFDLEWELIAELPVSWWVLRNVLALVPSLPTTGHGLGAPSLAELYRRLCSGLGTEPDLEVDIGREAALQAELGGPEVAEGRDLLLAVLDRPLLGAVLPPRDPQQMSLWQAERGLLLREIISLQAALASVEDLASGLRWLGDTVANQQRTLESIDGALRWLAEKVTEKG